jgi:hypothetical protein
VIRFDQNRCNRWVRFRTYRRRGQIVIIAQTDNPKADEHRKYARFAAYCLSQGNGASDPDARDMQRRMALEWLKLADALLHPAQPPK